MFSLRPPASVEIRRLIGFAAETEPIVIRPREQFLREAGALFPEAGELIGAILGKSAAPAMPDEYGMGPFVTVPADGVSDDLLRRYARVWAPEEGDSR